jgi:hypothetical protein
LLLIEYYLFSQDAKPSQQRSSRGGSYENSRFQNNNSEQGNNDNAYAGGYNRGGAPLSQQQQQPTSTQVYRPPHMQNRMNIPKYNTFIFIFFINNLLFFS